MRKNFTPKYDFFTNNKDIVVAVCHYTGRTVRAEARCNPIDTFSFEKGKEIAKARVDLKVAQLRHKKAKVWRESVNKQLNLLWEENEAAHIHWLDAYNKMKDAELHLMEALS